MTERIQAAQCTSETVSAWLATRLKWQSPEALYSWLQPLFSHDPGRVLLGGVVRLAGERNLRQLLSRIEKDHKTALRGDDECWALVGWAYIQFDHYRSAIRWLGDWSQRSARPNWALENLVLAHMSVHNISAAIAVARAIIEEVPDYWPAHLWLAADAAMSNRYTEAAHHLSRVGNLYASHYLHPMWELLQGWALAHRENTGKHAAAAFHTARIRRNGRPSLDLLRRRLGWQLVARARWWQQPLLAYRLLYS
jgi:hypothetical protein